MHAQKRKGAFHEPARPSNRSLPWLVALEASESGAEDARTPNADAWSTDSAGAKRLECARFIGALRLTRRGRQPNSRSESRGAVHEQHGFGGCDPIGSGAGPPRSRTLASWPGSP